MYVYIFLNIPKRCVTTKIWCYDIIFFSFPCVYGIGSFMHHAIIARSNFQVKYCNHPITTMKGDTNIKPAFIHDKSKQTSR